MSNSLNDRFIKAKRAAAEESASKKSAAAAAAEEAHAAAASAAAKRRSARNLGRKLRSTRSNSFEKWQNELMRIFGHPFDVSNPIWRSNIFSFYGNSRVRKCYKAVTKGSDVPHQVLKSEGRFLVIGAGPDHSFVLEPQINDEARITSYDIFKADYISPFLLHHFTGKAVRSSEPIAQFSNRDDVRTWVEDQIIEGAALQHEGRPKRIISATLLFALAVGGPEACSKAFAEDYSDVNQEQLVQAQDLSL